MTARPGGEEDVTRATYDPITVVGPEIVGVRLPQDGRDEWLAAAGLGA